MANESIQYYDQGDDLTCIASNAITGMRFVAITGNRGTGTANNYTVGQVTVSGTKVLGVSKYDAAAGDFVGVHANTGRIVPVTAGATLTANQEVQSDASGQAIVLAAGKAAGLCMTGAASGAIAEIRLYV